MWAAYRGRVDDVMGIEGRRIGHADVLHALDVGGHFRMGIRVHLLEHLARHCAADHPATVSRALARPPPRTSRNPYLAS